MHLKFAPARFRSARVWHQSTPSDSKDLARQCIADMAANGIDGRQIDMGSGTHTEFNSNPDASLNAFLDFMSLMDAAVIVRTGSSFSGMIVTMRGLTCRMVLDTVLTPRRLVVCTPPGMPC